MSNKEIIPFGKYKGQPVEVLAQDKQYLDWLMNQDWFNTRYATIKTLIINNFREPSETPEHNKIQAMFTDEAFCDSFLNHLNHLGLFVIPTEYRVRVPKAEAHTRMIHSDRYDDDKINYDHFKIGADNKLKAKTSCRFEQQGVDVFIAREYGSSKGHYVDSIGFKIEIKPALSDDYPSVLRQMMANESTILFTGSYSGQGATLDQVRKIFKASNRTIILLTDIQ